MNKDKLLADIRQAEGFRREAYKDNRGFWTAGYGHYLDQSKDWTGITFDQSTIDNWLSSDVDTAQRYCLALLEWPAMDCDARQNALVELVFNMGLSKWRGFVHTRECLGHKDWQGAYNGLLDSIWAHEVQPDGFEKPGRATRIGSYILTGSF